MHSCTGNYGQPDVIVDTNQSVSLAVISINIHTEVMFICLYIGYYVSSPILYLEY